MMPQEGIQVSHAELLDAFQEMHVAQYRNDFSTIVQYRAGLKKAEQIIADLRGHRDQEEVRLNEALKELAAAGTQIVELQKNVAYWIDQAEGKSTADSGEFKDDPITH